MGFILSEVNGIDLFTIRIKLMFIHASNNKIGKKLLLEIISSILTRDDFRKVLNLKNNKHITPQTFLLLMPILPDNRPPSSLSDTRALQFYQNFAITSKNLLWAGRPQLQWSYWLRIVLLMMCTITIIIFNVYFLQPSSIASLGALLMGGISLFLHLCTGFFLLSLWVLTRRHQRSYYAFDQEQLYLYNSLQNKIYTYPLATLPDFTLYNDRDGTSILRCSFRRSKTTNGKIYRTPVLYALPKGEAIFELLRQTQEEAKQQAAYEAANPSWLPLD